jgi:uncharacterized protein
MKKNILFLLFICSVFSTFAQDILGQWNGLLTVQGTQLHIVFKIAADGKGYTTTMDSPDQGAKDIPVTMTTFVENVLTLTVPAAKIVYTGKLTKDEIVGDFKQGTHAFPMTLTRGIQQKVEKAVSSASQIPVKPYPYREENVAFENKAANVKLIGTLTLPTKKGKYPVVVLISGSGPQNRDEEILGHKPFLVLADFLTRNGIAVLRYDDRGTGESSGDFATATSADFAGDVEAAVAFLRTRKDINKKKIGLMGHSEGGLIAPMVAAKDPKIGFIALLAGTGIRGDELLLMQQSLIGRASGATDEEITKNEMNNRAAFNIVTRSKDNKELTSELTSFLNEVFEKNPELGKVEGLSKEDFVQSQIEQMMNPWMQYFLKYDPKPTLEKVKCPVLAINGEKDLQVPGEVNLNAIKTAIAKGGNTNVTTNLLPNLNHLFQECDTGSPSEYQTIEQTFSPKALDLLKDWVLKTTK